MSLGWRSLSLSVALVFGAIVTGKTGDAYAGTAGQTCRQIGTGSTLCAARNPSDHINIGVGASVEATARP